MVSLIFFIFLWLLAGVILFFIAKRFEEKGFGIAYVKMTVSEFMGAGLSGLFAIFYMLVAIWGYLYFSTIPILREEIKRKKIN